MLRAGRRSQEIVRKLVTQAIVLGSFVAVFWLVELVDSLVLDGDLDGYGIKPRESGA